MAYKDDSYYLEKMIKDINFILAHMRNVGYSELAADEILLDSMQFRLVQIAESANKISKDFQKIHSDIDWQGISGLRDWLVHDYGNVDYTIVYKTLSEDIAELKRKLK